MQWKGPYEIIEKKVSMDYGVDMNSKVQTLHANLFMLKGVLIKNKEREKEYCLQLARH